MPLIYLNVAYAERGAAKALGERWDAEARKWFVPEGRDLAPFGAWLSAEQRSTDVAVAERSRGAVRVQRRGKSLSLLLAGVADAVDGVSGRASGPSSTLCSSLQGSMCSSNSPNGT